MMDPIIVTLAGALLLAFTVVGIITTVHLAKLGMKVHKEALDGTSSAHEAIRGLFLKDNVSKTTAAEIKTLDQMYTGIPNPS